MKPFADFGGKSAILIFTALWLSLFLTCHASTAAEHSGVPAQTVSQRMLRMTGFLEGSLSAAQAEQARKDADAWIESRADR